MAPELPRAVRGWLLELGSSVQYPNEVSVRSHCWVCRRHDDALIALLLRYVNLRHTPRACSRQCEELRISSEVISDVFYRLECSHYCASHIDHRCCVCRANDRRKAHL